MAKLLLSMLAVCALCSQSASADEKDANRNWPQWRGPLATGVAPNGDPPTDWSEEKNIRWKTELPGLGHSTPIVWGDRIFLTAAEPFGEAGEPKYSDAPGAHDNLPVTHQHRFIVLAVNRRDGKIAWQRAVHEALPHEGGHYTGSLASASPVTDGEHVFFFFGSYGLYCFDLAGKLVWKKDLGRMNSKHGHGEGASPALYGDTLIVNWDHEDRSFVVAFDKNTGEQRWKVNRDEVTSWASPIVVEQDGKPLVVISGTNRVRGYDLATGDVIWQCGGMSSNIVASPVSADGIVYTGSSYEKRVMLAIRLDGAKGDITDSRQVVWTRNHRTPYVPSPLLMGERLYFLGHYQGILTRLIAKTGEEGDGPFRLSGITNVYASPVGAAGRVYITDLDGTTLVLSDTEIPRVLAVNRLDEGIAASAAIVGKEIFLRGRKHLYCIASE